MNETLTPIPFMTVAMAVAVVRSSAGNHVEDSNGAAPMATGPPVWEEARCEMSRPTKFPLNATTEWEAPQFAK